jgi:hypothetical protein
LHPIFFASTDFVNPSRMSVMATMDPLLMRSIYLLFVPLSDIPITVEYGSKMCRVVAGCSNRKFALPFTSSSLGRARFFWVPHYVADYLQ